MIVSRSGKRLKVDRVAAISRAGSSTGYQDDPLMIYHPPCILQGSLGASHRSRIRVIIF